MDQAVSRALRILERLAEAGAPLRMSKLAEQVGLQKSTVHRILQTLVELGYVEQEPETNRYGASLKLWEMGSAVLVEHPVKRAASSFLQALHRETGETVSLLVPSGDDVLYLERLVSPRAVRFSARAGSRVAAALTAGGRAMLAHDPDARALIERTAERLRDHRHLDVDALLRELEEVRRRGYSISRDTPGVMSMGCALPGKDGRAAAAFSISAPIERLTEDRERQIAEALMSACATLTETVGLI